MNGHARGARGDRALQLAAAIVAVDATVEGVAGGDVVRACAQARRLRARATDAQLVEDIGDRLVLLVKSGLGSLRASEQPVVCVAGAIWPGLEWVESWTGQILAVFA